MSDAISPDFGKKGTGLATALLLIVLGLFSSYVTVMGAALI